MGRIIHFKISKKLFDGDNLDVRINTVINKHFVGK